MRSVSGMMLQPQSPLNQGKFDLFSNMFGQLQYQIPSPLPLQSLLACWFYFLLGQLTCLLLSCINSVASIQWDWCRLSSLLTFSLVLSFILKTGFRGSPLGQYDVVGTGYAFPHPMPSAMWVCVRLLCPRLRQLPGCLHFCSQLCTDRAEATGWRHPLPPPSLATHLCTHTHL